MRDFPQSFENNKKAFSVVIWIAKKNCLCSFSSYGFARKNKVAELEVNKRLRNGASRWLLFRGAKWGPIRDWWNAGVHSSASRNCLFSNQELFHERNFLFFICFTWQTFNLSSVKTTFRNWTFYLVVGQFHVLFTRLFTGRNQQGALSQADRRISNDIFYLSGYVSLRLHLVG